MAAVDGHRPGRFGARRTEHRRRRRDRPRPGRGAPERAETEDDDHREDHLEPAKRTFAWKRQSHDEVNRMTCRISVHILSLAMTD
jgi:hypothetical protein